MAGTAFARSMVVSRAVVFFCVARFESALQADGDWRGVGSAAAVDEHGRVHNLFWTAGEVAFGRAAVSGFLFRGAGSLAGIWVESRRAGAVATAFIIARPGHGTGLRVVAFR